jgi:formate hydrogenlyase subunit 6/NADH:ubiquinone oxidoreductase subunit I
MFGMLKPILKNAFGKPATRLYPSEKREAFEKARGQLEIDIDACLFCGTCMRKCPSACLAVDKANFRWELNPYNCVICGACVEVCPKKCLHLNNKFRTAAYTKEMYSQTGKPVKKAPPDGSVPAAQEVEKREA